MTSKDFGQGLRRCYPFGTLRSARRVFQCHYLFERSIVDPTRRRIMKVKQSLPILALPLVVGILLLGMQFQAKTNVNSLRRGALFPSQRLVIPTVPVLEIQDDDSNEILVKKQVTAHEELAPIVAAAPSAPRSRRGRQGTGDACIGPVCGLGLFFVSLALTFVTCFVVVYVADKRYDKVQRNRRRHDNYYENNQSRRASNGNLKFERHCRRRPCIVD